MKYWIPIFFLFLFPHIFFGQNTGFNNYQPLQAAGPLPVDFTTLSSVKFEKEKKLVDESEKKSVRESQEQFYLESNFFLDELLRSGRVLFGDPVSIYLNEIKDLILKDQPDIRKKVRIYTFRSNEVNAYTANNGIVIVSTGLIAQAENEAQLAFILCHELNHFIQEHAINSYVEKREIGRGNGIYKNLKPYELKLAQMNYSKELEHEADSLGLALYKKTGYNFQTVSRVFDVLLYSYLPFDEVPFPKDYFNVGSYQLPSEFFLDELNEIIAVEDYDDEISTHPNIKKRRVFINHALSELNDEGRNQFIISEERFNNLRKICRYESLVLSVNDVELEKALYNAFLLLEDEPENPWLKNQLATILYLSSQYESQTKMHENYTIYKRVEGQSQQVYYLLQEMPKSDLNVLALRMAWLASENEKQNETLKEECKQLASSLVNEYGINWSEFSHSYPNLNDTVQVEEEKKTVSKYDKIKVKSDKSESAYWRYAFVEFMEDESFHQLFTGVKIKEEKEEIEEKKYSWRSEETLEKEKVAVRKLVVVNPYYLRVDFTAKNPIRFIASETQRGDMKNKLKECAQLLDMKVDFLESWSLKTDQTEKFNELSVLNNWISEELIHDEADVINSYSGQMKQLAEKYGTEYFAWLGVASFKEPEQNVGAKLFYTFYFLPVLPFVLLDIAQPNYETVVFMIVMNAKDGEFEYTLLNEVGARDINSIQKSNFYYFLQQISSQKK